MHMRRHTATMTRLAACASRSKQLRHVYHTGYTHTHSHYTLRTHIMISSQLLRMRMPTHRATQRTCRGVNASRRLGSCDLTLSISPTITQHLTHIILIFTRHTTPHILATCMNTHTCIHTSCIICHSHYTSLHPACMHII